MKRLKKELLAALALILALAVFSYTLAAVMIPPRKGYGSNWNAYLAEKKDSIQALFFGSSLCYCDVVPAVIRASGGAASYVMAGPEQTPAMTYYYLRETLRTQQPQAIFMEVTGVFFDRYTNFTKVNAGYMPWGLNRLGAIFRASEKKQRLGLLFPLYNYHDRWNELPKMDFSVLWKHTPDDLAGYTFLDRSAALTGIEERKVDFDEQTYRDNIAWLKKIASYCAEKGVTPVFYISPSWYRLNDRYLEMLRRDLPAGAVFRDFNETFGTLGLNTQTDFYDNMHFNWRGAEKFSAALAGWMNELGIEPRPADDALWQSRLAAFDALKDGAQ